MKLFRRLRYWLRRKNEEAAMAEEMEHHRQLLLQEGVPPQSFGNTLRTMEEARQVWIWGWLESVAQDLRYALRSLRRQPSFTFAALLAITLGLGLNASLFTAFNAVALKPWPVHQPENVVTLYNVLSKSSSENRHSGFSITEARYLNQNAKTLNGVVAFRPMGVQLGVEAAGEKSKACFISGNFFNVLGVGMTLGRGFTTEEDMPGSPLPVVILSHRIWRNHFGSDPEIISKEVRVDNVLLTVVGVVSEEFQGMDLMDRDIWIPLETLSLLKTSDEERRWTQSFLTQADFCCSSIAARLAPGSSRQSAASELEAIHLQYGKQHQIETSGIWVHGTENLGTPGTAKAVPILSLFSIATILILFLACANVSNLLLARGSARIREFEMRLSLGATRGRLIRQLMTESFLLAAAAGILSALIAAILPDLLVRWAFGEPPIHFTPDWTVLIFIFGLTSITCFGFALIPAFRSTRLTIADTKVKLSLRGTLLAIQVAVSVILLINAGVLLRAIERTHHQSPGLAISNRIIAALQFPVNQYSEDQKHSAIKAVTENIHRLAPMKQIAFTAQAPLGTSRNWTGYRMPHEDKKTSHEIRIHSISPGYFDTLRIPILAGRDFHSLSDQKDFIIVNQRFANQISDSAPIIGRAIIVNNRPREIIGIVRDAYIDGWEEIPPSVFEPLEVSTVTYAVIETEGALPLDLLRSLIAQADSRIQIQTYPLSQNLDRQLKPVIAGAQFASLLGMLALILASVGIFGVFSYIVQQRKKEIGIRIAIGATSKQIIQKVLGASSIPLALGSILGITLAIPLANLLKSQFIMIHQFDLPAILGVLILLSAAAMIASYIPVRRATGIDPMESIRHE